MGETMQNAAQLMSTLPPANRQVDRTVITQAKADRLDAIIVLDDDPTGTQTVHGVPVLTTWSVAALLQELQARTPLFFILTNSRSLSAEAAENLAHEIGQNIRTAAQQHHTRYWVISRSDSTLRGHYPAEVTALEAGLQRSNNIRFLIPAFFAGGRYTIDDIHYVQRDQRLIPAAQTPYAQDQVFGYRSSNLKAWVREKSPSTVDIMSFSIAELRTNSIDSLVGKLNQLPAGATCIVNAADPTDLRVFALALLQSKPQPTLRTAASFVSAIAGLTDRPLLTKTEVRMSNGHGGLIIVGSYVPTTSAQLEELLQQQPQLQSLTIDVNTILRSTDTNTYAAQISRQVNETIRAGKSLVVFTSRNLVTGDTEQANQNIGQRISHFITRLVTQLQICPAYLLTKGGITSSDVATEGLRVQRAMVLGQIVPGVPVWQSGAEAKFPGLAQIIFPGNVGTKNTLSDLIQQLESPL